MLWSEVPGKLRMFVDRLKVVSHFAHVKYCCKGGLTRSRVVLKWVNWAKWIYLFIWKFTSHQVAVYRINRLVVYGKFTWHLATWDVRYQLNDSSIHDCLKVGLALGLRSMENMRMLLSVLSAVSL